MKTKYFLEGNKVGLRSVELEDFTVHNHKWVNDGEVTKYLFRGIQPTTKEDGEKEFHQIQQNKNDLVWTVCGKDKNDPIGIVGLHSISWIARHAEFRILIGEKDYWSKGIGTECTMLLTAYGFERLNLNKVWLGVNSENEGAYQTYVKSHFVLEGELRAEFYRNGRYSNVRRMSMLRSEYEEKKSSWPIFKLIQSQLVVD